MVSTVGTTTTANPLTDPYQKKCFFANGRWWAWYNATSTSFGWRTSTDGASWSSFTEYGTAVQNLYDLWYDETNNKICLVHGVGSGSIYYRQGTANGDGTITWDSAEVLVYAATQSYGPTVCKDSDGYPWVSFRDTGATSKVCKATTTTGSAWGSPTTLWTSRAAGNERIKIVPLTGGKMLALSFANSLVVQSRLFNGSWASAVNASTSNAQGYNKADGIADGDNAHLAFLKLTTYDIIYAKYTYGSGWGAEETVESAAVNQYHPSITLKSADKTRVFYLDSQTVIKYRDRESGSWQDAVTISDAESTMVNISSSTKPISSKICVTWKSGAASPYNVRFEGYDVTGAILKEVADSVGLADVVLRNKSFALTDVVGLADVILRNKTLAITDSVSASEVVKSDKSPLIVADVVSLADFVAVITGAVLKVVADAIGLADVALRNKTVIVSDALSVLDQVFRHKPAVAVSDAIGALEVVLVTKLLTIADSVGLADVAKALKTLNVFDVVSLVDVVSTPSRVLRALDAVGLADGALVNKTLVITESISLVEVVVCGAFKKTKLFLVLGDLAIQIAG